MKKALQSRIYRVIMAYQDIHYQMKSIINFHTSQS